MAFLLAKLGRVVGDRRREIFARGKTTAQEVGAPVLALPDDSIVLLEGTGPPWLRAALVKPSPWPSDLGAFEDLVERKRQPMKIDVSRWLAVHGQWLLDPTGRPVEQGHTHVAATTILNYAGWRLGDFPDGEIEVVASTAPRGSVLIVPPRSVPKPGGAEPVGRRPEPEPRATAPRRPRQAQPLHFEERFRFAQLEFADGAISFSVHGRKVTVQHNKALALYQDVRKELDAEQPGGVSAKGELLPDGTSTATITGIDSLDRLFARVQQGQFVRKSLASQDWLEAEELARWMPAGTGDADPAALIDVEEFGLKKRAEAFRRLFAHRDRSIRVAMLPGRAVIIPMAAQDGGHRSYAWEVVTNDYATYIFRPKDNATVRRLRDWTRDPGHRRRELLGDKDLQRELGFQDRVIHDANEHDLALGGAGSAR